MSIVWQPSGRKRMFLDQINVNGLSTVLRVRLKRNLYEIWSRSNHLPIMNRDELSAVGLKELTEFSVERSLFFAPLI